MNNLGLQKASPRSLKSHHDHQKLKPHFHHSTPLFILKIKDLTFLITFQEVDQNPTLTQTPSQLNLDIPNYKYLPSNDGTPPPHKHHEVSLIL